MLPSAATRAPAWLERTACPAPTSAPSPPRVGRLPKSHVPIPLRLVRRLRARPPASGLVAGAVGLVILASVVVGFLVTRPVPTTASMPAPIVPLQATAFSSSVRTGTSVTGAATITFSTPMERVRRSRALGRAVDGGGGHLGAR